MNSIRRKVLSVNAVLIFILVIVCANTQIAFARGGHSRGHSGGHLSSYYSGGSRSSSHSYHSGGYSSRSHSGNAYGRSTAHSRLGVSRHSYASRTHYSGGSYKSGYPKVERSQSAKYQFLRQHRLTHVPAGYHVDHIRPLSQGGSDTPSNMQLLSVEAHHQKTAAERRKY
jgi:5-methylcytosine-specific restriction endonuclease McrA